MPDTLRMSRYGLMPELAGDVPEEVQDVARWAHDQLEAALAD